MLILLLCLALVLIACSGVPTVETHDNLVDYLEVANTPVPSVTPIRASSTPPLKPSITPTPILLAFTGDVYRHPQELFEFPLPDGWVLVKEQEGAAEFNNPSEGISIHVFVTNTGVALDEEAFQTFVDAQEVNFFGAYPGYIEVERQIDQANNTTMVEKSLTLNDESQQVISLYRQVGESILTLNIWSTSALSNKYIGEFKSFFVKISLFSDKISTQPIYRWVYEFLSDDGLYTGLVPLQWKREHINTDTTQIDRFVSPDLKAVVQLTLFDDGKKLSKKDAGLTVLILLQQEYDPDLIIVEDQLIPQGGELLIWKTPQSGIRGATHFEIKETTLKIITWLYSGAEENIYRDLLQMTYESIHAVE